MTDSQRSRFGWLVAIVAGVVVAVGLGLWLSKTPSPELRDQLTNLHFWFLEGILTAVVGLSLYNLRELVAATSGSRRTVFALVGISLICLLMLTWVVPKTNRIYFDEHIYQGIAHNLTDLHQAQMCNEGTVEYGHLQCQKAEYNKQPYAYPHLLSVAYRIVGVGEGPATAVNNLAAIAAPWVVFLIAALAFGSSGAGVMAALASIMIPYQLLWANTAASEPTAALAAALSFLAVFWFTERRSTPALWWAVLSTVWAMQFRPESVLCGIVAAIVILVRYPRVLRESRFWLAVAVGIALSANLLGHLAAVRNEAWGSSGDRFSLEYAIQNFKVNGAFYLRNIRFPILVTLLAVVGLSFPKRRLQAILVAVYFAAFFTIFLTFYAGSYNYGADIRYSLMTYLPLAILAGAGGQSTIEWLSRLTSPRRAALVVVAALLVNFSWFSPLLRATSEEAWGARLDVEFAHSVIADLPPNSFVLSHNPNLFHLNGVNSGQTMLAITEQDHVRNGLPRRYSGGVFFHWNFWCNVDDPQQADMCQEILRTYNTDLVTEQKHRHYRSALYRLNVR